MCMYIYKYVCIITYMCVICCHCFNIQYMCVLSVYAQIQTYIENIYMHLHVLCVHTYTQISMIYQYTHLYNN